MTTNCLQNVPNDGRWCQPDFCCCCCFFGGGRYRVTQALGTRLCWYYLVRMFYCVGYFLSYSHSHTQSPSSLWPAVPRSGLKCQNTTIFRTIFTRVSKSDWFYLTISHDWLRKLAPFSRPIRSKTKPNRDSRARVFPRFTSASCIFV